MLYPRKEEKQLDGKLFRNPSSEYRGTPFWAWNCRVTKEIVHVAENLLISPYEKHSEIIWLTRFDTMDRKRRRCAVVSDEVGYLAV